MDNQEKIYTNIVTEDTPLPDAPTQSANGVYTNQTIPDNPLSQPVVADHVINNNLNTQSKKILGSFSFTPTGAIQIGKFTKDESGEVKISPDGIVATNKQGQQTITLGGDTGDADFLGRIHASGVTIVDPSGLVSDLDANFRADDISVNSEQNTNSSTFVDVPGGQISFTLARQARVLIFIHGYGLNDNFDTGTNSMELRIFDTLSGGVVVNGVVGVNVFISGVWFTQVDWDTMTGLINSTTVRFGPESQSNINIVPLVAGKHTLKMQFRAADAGNAHLYNCRVGYVVLGN